MWKLIYNTNIYSILKPCLLKYGVRRYFGTCLPNLTWSFFILKNAFNNNVDLQTIIMCKINEGFNI